MTEMTNLKPETVDQLCEAVAWANAERKPLNVRGHGSKDAIGCARRPSIALDMSAFSGVTLYEPEELVLSAGAGTPLADIEDRLEQNNQRLAFEPPDYSRLLHNNRPGKGTLGGLVASNLSGPRRLQAGAVRDHFLGFEAVSGRAERFKSGGRVVKNVTGYDLCKLMCGSWGTLGVMHSITLKALPRPEETRTVLIMGVPRDQAAAVLAEALNTPYDISGACWLPESALKSSSVGMLQLAKAPTIAVRVEGPAPSVAYRCKALRDLLKPHGKPEELHTANSGTLWREIRDVHPFCTDGDDRVIWKISTAPSDSNTVIGKLTDLNGIETVLDWGGGLTWLAVDAPKVGAEGLIRDAVNAVGGHATLIRGSEDLRGKTPVFHPQPAPLRALTKRLKEGFDPSGILNPGRIYEGV